MEDGVQKNCPRCSPTIGPEIHQTVFTITILLKQGKNERFIRGPCKLSRLHPCSYTAVPKTMDISNA